MGLHSYGALVVTWIQEYKHICRSMEDWDTLIHWQGNSQSGIMYLNTSGRFEPAPTP